MADNNNGYWPADNGGQPEQPQNDNLQQDAPTTSDAQDQQFAQEPLGAPQEAPAQNDDAQQPQPEAQDTRPTQPLAPVAPTSEQAQASEPTQPLPPQPTQPLYRPAPEYGAYGPTPTQPEPQQPQPTQQQNQNTGNGGNPFFNGNPFMTRPTDDASQQNRQNGNTPYGFPVRPARPERRPGSGHGSAGRRRQRVSRRKLRGQPHRDRSGGRPWWPRRCASALDTSRSPMVG